MIEPCCGREPTECRIGMDGYIGFSMQIVCNRCKRYVRASREQLAINRWNESIRQKPLFEE